MRLVDAAIRRLHEMHGWGARRIAEELGDNYATVGKRMVRLGLRAAGSNAMPAPPSVALPFRLDAAPQNKEAIGMQGSVAMGVAIRWFLERGYTPSLPFTQAAYDLVVESEEGLQRVQVKFTSVKNGTGPASSFAVPVHRKLYQAGTSARAKTAYTKRDTDLFFILTSEGDQYLIPLEVIGEKKFICLGEAYAAYRV